MICYELMEAGKVEWIFFTVFCEELHKSIELDLSMGAHWLVGCVTLCVGLAITFVGCCDCPEFLL